jgi:GNAT superfamily N-acetyltransferase
VDLPRASDVCVWIEVIERSASAQPRRLLGLLIGTTRVFVVTEHAGNQVVAYYAWCVAQVMADNATDRLRKGAGRYPQPVALLARLGVDTDHEGRGLGVGLLQDVFARLLELSADIGCRGLIVHAASTEAREFYLHLVPELEPSPTDDFHLLLLLMKDIRRALRS